MNDGNSTAMERLSIWAMVETWITLYRSLTNCTVEAAVLAYATNDGLTPLEVFMKGQQTP